MGSEGKVLTLPDNKGYVEIQTGSMKMRVKVSDLRLIEKKTEKKKETFVRRETESRLNAASDTRCDLRGMNVEEGIMTLDQFIDSMVMSGLHEFTIIHGKGTGVLRAAVQQHLKKHPQVKTYRLGTFGEGENGVTIATLK
jgi:DNA mismatch repair protein MutS2